MIHAVFLGSKMEKWGAFKETTDLARDLTVVDQVHYLGYVDNVVISALYK